MRSASDTLVAAIAVVTGAGAWELVRLLGRRREAWDDPVFWQLGYPLMLFAALVLGMLWRDRPWRWVVAMMAGQAAWSFALAILRDGVPNPFPLGLVMFAVLGLPCLLAAYAGKWVGDRVSA
jgi:peptidoglycan/LPS O-acetylase OafA/YrhL